MATYDETMQALRNAHAAGDTAAAQRLARMAQAARSAEPAPDAAPERSTWDAIVDNVVGRDDGVMSFGEKLGTAINSAAESATAGLGGDEANAAIEAAGAALAGGDFGDTYAARRDHYRDNQAQFREENPYLALGADVGGGLVGALLTPGVGALGQGGHMLSRVVGSALAGGVGGATYGFMEGEGGFDNRFDNAKTTGTFGAGVGLAAPVIGAGIQRGVDRFLTARAIRRAAAAAPDDAALQAQAQALFRQADDLQIPRQQFAPVADDLLATARREGMDEMLTPTAERVAGKMGDIAADPNPTLGWAELDTLRRQAAIPAGDIQNRTQAALGSKFIEGIDNFVDEAAPETGEALSEARRMWSILRRSERLDEAFNRAQNSTSGLENGLRNEFRRILNSPALRRGFSPEEITAMERVVRGTVLGNLLRQAGRLAPSFDSRQSNALGALLGASAGGAVGGGVGAVAVPLASAGAKALSDRSTRQAAELVRALTRSGGVQDVPQITDQTRAIIEALLRGGSRPLLPGAQ